MGRIFYIFGKSSTGKDSFYRKLIDDERLGLSGVVSYTTRPMRAGEIDGKDYHFITEEQLEEYRAQGRVIESRTYDTVHGKWTYATIDDGSFDDAHDLLTVGVLESYVSLKEYFGEDRVIPIYIEVEDGIRLERALHRERKQEHPKYAEMCRRFLADTEDFSEERLAAAGVRRRYINDNFGRCLREIRETIAGRDL